MSLKANMKYFLFVCMKEIITAALIISSEIEVWVKGQECLLSTLPRV